MLNLLFFLGGGSAALDGPSSSSPLASSCSTSLDSSSIVCLRADEAEEGGAGADRLLTGLGAEPLVAEGGLVALLLLLAALARLLLALLVDGVAGVFGVTCALVKNPKRVDCLP